MRILYLGGHWTNEYDDVKLFSEMGFEVFSPWGNYRDPEHPQPMEHPDWGRTWWTPVEGGYRPPVTVHKDLRRLLRFCPKGPPTVPRQVIEYFDIVLALGVPQWITANWSNMQDKVVIWRSNGQTADFVERGLLPYREAGMKVLRCSPRELLVGGVDNLGADAVIRCYNDPEEWYGWRGDSEQLLCVCVRMLARPDHCNRDVWDNLRRGFNNVLYGPGNDGLENAAGALPMSELQEAYRSSRVFFAANTKPSPYTGTFREAWMTGTPVLAVGPQLGNFPGHTGYELHELVENGVTGFWSDNLSDLRHAAQRLMQDYDLAQKISAAARARAVEVFGKEVIREQWQRFFSDHLP